MSRRWRQQQFSVHVCAWMLVACGAQPTPTAQQHQAITVCAAGATLPGIDVSTYDGNVDWTMVAASGIQFAYIRVSDGLDFPDDQFAANWANSQAAGVIRGAYQYFRPDQDPVAQANYLLTQMGTLQANDLPPVIDIEIADGLTQAQVTASIHQWVDTVQAALGRAPIFYAGLYSWPTLSGSSDFAAYHLWIPQYGPTCPDLPVPWTNWTIFQYSDTGTVPGYTDAADLDEFNGTMADLLAVAAERMVCGDGMCTAGESTATCPADCPNSCANVPAAGRIVDESEACFAGGGDPAYLRHVTTAGWESTLIWTHTTSAAAPANYGIWQLTFDQAGMYSIEAYTAAPWAQSMQALYLVQHNGAMDMSTVNQTMIDGWSPVGQYEFAAGGSQWVRLNDDTGEPSSNNVQLVFDALRITRLDGPATGDAGGTGDAGAADDVGPIDDAAAVDDAGVVDDTGPDARAVETGVASDVGNDNADAHAVDAGTQVGAEGAVTPGCGCAVPGRRTRSVPAMATVGMLLLAVCARRRRYAA